MDKFDFDNNRVYNFIDRQIESLKLLQATMYSCYMIKNSKQNAEYVQKQLHIISNSLRSECRRIQKDIDEYEEKVRCEELENQVL